jgi:hypothetical protein
VKEALIVQVTWEFDKNVKSIIDCLEAEMKVLPDNPRLQKSTDADKAMRELENQEYELDYKDKIKRYNMKIEELDNALIRVYGLVGCNTKEPDRQ